MSSSPHFAVPDLRTADELARFGHAMPQVSAALKRVLESDGFGEAARLLPSLAYVTGLSCLGISDIVMVGGGSLLDKYANAERVMKELAGTTVASGQGASLDFDLHTDMVKWRQLLIQLHREAVAIEKDDRDDRVSALSMEKQLTSFEKAHNFLPEPQMYSTGMYAKAINKAGLTFALDDRTDWRRSSPASGRRVTDILARRKER